MQVKTLKVNDFQGLKGIQEYHFGKITALAQPNGSGKTSLINALRYGLTGVEPSGDMITRGAESTAVRVELENGSNFLRQKYAQQGKPSKYYVGKSKTTLSKLNEYISHELGGVDIATAKTISSGELLTSLTSQQFGEMLLSYLPESMTVDTVLKRFSSANEAQKEVIREWFPSEEFSIDKLNEFHKVLVDRRKMIKQKLIQKEAVLSSLGNEAPEYTVDELKTTIENLNKKRDDLIAVETNAKYYQQVEQQIAQRNNQVVALDNQIKELEGQELYLNEVNQITKRIEDYTRQIDSVRSVMAAFTKIKQAMDKAAEKLDGEDKDALVEAAKEVVPMYASQRDIFISLTPQLKELVKQKEDAYQRAVALKKSQIDEKLAYKKQLLEQELTLPPKPDGIDSPAELKRAMTEINQEINRLHNLVPVVVNYNKKDQLVASITELTKKHADYDGMVLAFSPKGEVKEAITSYYMDEFADPCNEKASKLFPGMSLKFVTEKGVKVLTDPNGSGNYLDFHSLSGGEQASVMFLLVSMLSSLSGMGVIILDELSVLDDDVFNNLVRVLKENESEYDMCLMASVDHTDTIATLNKYNIPILTIEGVKADNKISSVNSDEVVAAIEMSDDEELISEDSVDDYELPLDDDLVDEISSDDNRDLPSEDKTSKLTDLKNLVNETMDVSKDLRFTPSDDNVLEDELLDDDDESLENEVINKYKEESEIVSNMNDNVENDNLLESLGLTKGKSAEVVDFIREETDSENLFHGTAKDISETLSISQPTVGKVMKKLQDNNFVTLLKRGVWKVSEQL